MTWWEMNMVAMPHIPKSDAEQASSSQDRAVFIARAVTAVVSLSKTLDQETIRGVTRERTDIGMLMRALSDPQALRNALSHEAIRDDPLAHARVRGLANRLDLLEREGGTLAAAEVARHLDLSRQGVDQRRRNGKLIAFQIGRRGFRYPRWQFDEHGVIPHFERVLDFLEDHDPWMRAAFFLNAHPWLDGERPLDRLRRGDVEAVISAAKTYGHQVAV